MPKAAHDTYWYQSLLVDQVYNLVMATARWLHEQSEDEDGDRLLKLEAHLLDVIGKNFTAKAELAKALASKQEAD